MNSSKRHEIFSRLKTANPYPATELVYNTPFELLVAVILSAQATDRSVNQATKILFLKANTPKKIHALGETRLRGFIKSIGLYKTKTKNILETCRLLIQNHNGNVPQTRDELETLPGVGHKTANVILNTAFGEPTIAVDTHIYRVANRTGLAAGKNVSEVEIKLLKFVPKEFHHNAHHWLILHGRYVCKARKPECARCIIEDLCDFTNKTVETNAPHSLATS